MAQAPRQIVAASASSATGVPTDWRRQAAHRLGLLAAVVAGLGLLAVPMAIMRQQNLGARAGYERPLWVIPAVIVTSALMWWSTRSEERSAERKLDLGLGYLVVLAAIAAIFRHSLPYDPSDVVRGFSPLVVGIVVFAIVVPLEPKRIAVAATLAALCDPLALAGWVVLAGHPLPPWNLWMWLILPTLLSVGVSVMLARLFYSIGQSLERAQRMGRYRLIELLGRGGMGEVWRAEHDTLARRAAIKLIRPDVLDQGDRALSLARFEREAQATAGLGSPHAIELYDYGVSEDGTFFYVMELLEGRDLAQVLADNGVLAPARAVYLLEQICHSLRDAHEQRVIHRDIKPANIYVCKKGSDYDFVKVLDFGLAKRLTPDEIDLTQTNSVAGTPRYMAPETIRGEPAGTAADVYAVACVAYRMLTGHDVFEASGVMAVLVQHLQAPPRPILELAPALAPELAELIMQCLAKDPSSRPPDAGALLERLRATNLAASWSQGDARGCWSASADLEARAPTMPARGQAQVGATDETGVDARVGLEDDTLVGP